MRGFQLRESMHSPQRHPQRRRHSHLRLCSFFLLGASLLLLLAGCEGEGEGEPGPEPAPSLQAPPDEEHDETSETTEEEVEVEPLSTDSDPVETLDPLPFDTIDEDGTGLLDSEWEFREAGTLPLDEVPARPHLHFDPQESRLSGSTGCNRILGTFRLDELELTFSPEATTRMACPEPADEVEAGILQILDRTRSYRKMDDGTLELLDDDGGVLARLARIV